MLGCAITPVVQVSILHVQCCLKISEKVDTVAVNKLGSSSRFQIDHVTSVAGQVVKIKMQYTYVGPFYFCFLKRNTCDFCSISRSVWQATTQLPTPTACWRSEVWYKGHFLLYRTPWQGLGKTGLPSRQHTVLIWKWTMYDVLRELAWCKQKWSARNFSRTFMNVFIIQKW